MIQRIQKWFAIRSYAKGLGPKLQGRYGASKYYTPEQVKATVQEYGLNSSWICYALCMYCDYASFTQYHTETGETYDYEAMQSEVAEHFHNPASSDKVDGLTVIDNTNSWRVGGGYDAGGSCDTDGFDGGGSCDGGGD